MDRSLVLASISARFLAFADNECGPYAPTYDRLSRAVAGDPAAAACTSAARPGQQIPNLFLAVVHLLLGDTIRDISSADFLRWCHANQARLAHECATRLVQTNEVRRCSYLLPTLAHVAAADRHRHLALVEVGAAAGLLLALDRYRYEYRFTPEASVAATAGDPDSPVLVACDLHGSRIPPVDLDFGLLASRSGIDLAPVWPGDADGVAWLRALVWPDHPDRRARLDRALELVATDGVPIVGGDALDVLPAVIASCSPEVTPVVFHQLTVEHFERAAAQRFWDLVPRLAASRGGDLVWIAVETGTRSGRHVEVVDFRRPHPGPLRLAEVHAHGAWLRWLSSLAQ